MTARPFNGKLVGVGLTSCAVLRPENGAGRQAGYAKQGGREKGFKGKKRKMSYRGEWEWFYLVRM